MDNRRGLGRGLRALIPGEEKAAPETPTREIPLEIIRRNPYQPRKFFDPNKIAELSESILRHGVLQPLVVRPKDGLYELIAGERRFEASKRAGLTSVPAVVREVSDEESLELALVENVQREDITVIEAAIAYRRLSDEFGLSQEEIALRVGKSRSAIANTLRLLNLPEEVQDSLTSGEISEGHARALLGLSDYYILHRVWQDAVHSGASVRETEQMVRDALHPREELEALTTPSPARAPRPDPGPPPFARGQDPNLQQIEADLRRMLGTKVEIRQAGNKGAILIEFYSEDDLERILGLMTE